MLELLGYLACGAMIGLASVLGGRMRPHEAAARVGAGMIVTLLLSLAPHLGAPHDEVRAALAAEGQIALCFFLALLAAFVYIAFQILDAETPDELRPGLQRWESHIVALGGMMLLLGLAATKLTLAA